MSARRMGAVVFVVASSMVGSVTDANAQSPSPASFAFVEAGAVPQQPAPAAAPAPPAPPATQVQAPPPPLPAPGSARPPAPPAAPAPLPAPGSARPPASVRTGPRLTSLSAVLVAGDEGPAPAGRGSAPQLEVPDAAKKALASISSFLPYKTYSMVDAGLISVSSNSGGVIGLRDPALEGTSLRLFLNPQTPPPGVDTYDIRVALSEVDATKPDYNKTSRSVISASVNIALGETVVVGTSRIGGGRKAYVLLLTAIGK